MCSIFVTFYAIYFSKILNVMNQNGKTALHAAALRNRQEIVKLLLDSGVDINIKDEVSTVVCYEVLLIMNNNYSI